MTRLLLCFLSFSYIVQSQNIVINKYFNTSSGPTGEWSELLVISDNLDLRGYRYGDNTLGMNSWQNAITFTGNALWQNVRAGTIIIIRHGTSPTNDADPSDGFLDLGALNTFYFSTTSNNTPNIDGVSDIVRIQNSSGAHVHALGHSSSPGPDWAVFTATGLKSLMYNASITSGNSIHVCDGANLLDYFGDCSTNCAEYGNSKIIKIVSNTPGLPNTCGGITTINENFWRGLREPTITNQSYIQSVSGSNLVLTFLGATDPNPNDNTQGYLILRNTSDNFITPPDGSTYALGGILGSATIIGIIKNTVNGTNMSIETPAISGTNYYKFYAYRYSTDNINGDNYFPFRGRAYNTDNSITINTISVTPLRISLVNFNGKHTNNQTILHWSTIHEENNNGFSIERSKDGIDFNSIGFILSKKQGYHLNNYSFKDPLHFQSTYYRLKQVDNDNKYEYSHTLYIQPEIKSTSFFSISPNPFKNEFTIETNHFEHLFFTIKDLNGNILENHIYKEFHPKISVYSTLQTGIYIGTLQTESDVKTLKLIKTE
jgi:hypothetical protein